MYNFSTDLADERAEYVKGKINQKDIDGIITENDNYSDNLSVCRVKVINKKGSKKIDKKIGNYITINVNDMDILSDSELQEITKILSKELAHLLHNYKKILIVGLGNENSTADSIGPKVIKDLQITRHLLKYNPGLLPENILEISAIAPGVLGTTGIETQEILKGIVSNLELDAIIVVDALASNNISRLLKTIQLCDTGIVPGSGVENKRKEISLETMGIPVVAVGVPTVVNAATIVADTLDIMVEKFDEFSFIKDSSYEDKYELIKAVLEPAHFNLAVMPKEVDTLVDNMKDIISSGINSLIGL